MATMWPDHDPREGRAQSTPSRSPRSPFHPPSSSRDAGDAGDANEPGDPGGGGRGELAWGELLASAAKLPFSPRLWRQSALAPTRSVVVPIIAIAVLASLIDSWWFSRAAHTALDTAVAHYAANADPLVLDHGEFSLAGSRALLVTQNATTVLIDPAETVPTGDVLTQQAIIVRQDRIIVRQGQKVDEITAEDLSQLLGPERIVFDAEYVRSRVAGSFLPMIVGLYGTVALLGTVVSCILYAALSGSMLVATVGRRSSLAFPEAFRVALAASSITIVLDLVLRLWLAIDPSPGVLVWNVAIVCACVVALSQPDTPATEPEHDLT